MGIAAGEEIEMWSGAILTNLPLWERKRWRERGGWKGYAVRSRSKEEDESGTDGGYT
jgi:hypothetical protein